MLPLCATHVAANDPVTAPAGAPTTRMPAASATVTTSTRVLWPIAHPQCRGTERYRPVVTDASEDLGRRHEVQALRTATDRLVPAAGEPPPVGGPDDVVLVQPVRPA